MNCISIGPLHALFLALFCFYVILSETTKACVCHNFARNTELNFVNILFFLKVTDDSNLSQHDFIGCKNANSLYDDVCTPQ